MSRNQITRWLIVGLVIVLLWAVFGRRTAPPSGVSERQPLSGIDDQTAPLERAPEQMCTLEGSGIRAELSTRGASLKHLYLEDHRFDVDGRPADLVTTSVESRRPLRTDLRQPLFGGPQQVQYDDFDWKLAGNDGRSCTFTHVDAISSLKKTISLTGEPYQLAVDLEVKNLDSKPRTHRFTIEQTDFRTKKEMEGHLGRTSPLATEVVTVTTEKTERFHPRDFEPREFSKPVFTKEKWRRTPSEAKVAAVSSVYFTKLVVPIHGAGTPVAESQIEERWDDVRYPIKERDPNFGYAFRARIAYPAKELAPGESASYRALSFTGPKQRDLLAAVGHGATEVLSLGTFSFIARGMLWYLRVLHGVVASWGWSIVLLTVTVRVLLFPMSLSQIKSTAALRRLKPEMDALNEKYKSDATQRGLAIQELWRKNKVTNPVIGCLPMLLQLPVWWALYAALQSAVDLYHVPFGPVIPDLTAPGRYFVIPIALGASSLLQQKLMPAQGDPTQQKLMLYTMPAIFTLMMLFLPAGLGVYMLTSSLLAIVQQLVVQRYFGSPAGALAEGKTSAQRRADRRR